MKAAKKLIFIKNEYYKYLDKKARHIASRLKDNKNATSLLLGYISELYESSKLNLFESELFKSAYHNPISSDLEFLIARILYHFSSMKGFGWKIHLRCQKNKMAPDIRIDIKKYTIGVIEIKAKVGWIQPVFSKEKRITEIKRFQEKKQETDPKDIIKRFKKQLGKYQKRFKLKSEQIFVLIPSIKEAHRKKHRLESNDYKSEFANNSGLSESNLILLSNNLELNLSNKPLRKDFKPTEDLKYLIKSLIKYSSARYYTPEKG